MGAVFIRSVGFCFLCLPILVFGGTVSAFGAGSGQAGPAPKGEGEISLKSGQKVFRVFTYKPSSFSSGPVLFVFHGQKRNAAGYRDYAVPLADKLRAMVAAPWFEEENFPGSSYSQGKIFRENGTLEPRREWIFTTVGAIVRQVLAREGNPRRPYFLIGHSAGAQLLVRFSALENTVARRVVAANAGTYAFPESGWDWPYGFGGLPGDLGTEKNLRRFLAAPLTVMLGQADTNNTTEAGNFPATPEANRQGNHRLERGRNFFEQGRELAQRKGWEFGWEKVEIPGAGHDGKLILNELAMEKALSLKNKAP